MVFSTFMDTGLQFSKFRLLQFGQDIIPDIFVELCDLVDTLAFHSQPVQVSILKCPDHSWGPTSIVLSGYLGSCLGEGQTWCEAIPASTAGVRNEWSYTSTPPVFPHGIDRDFTCTLLLQDYSNYSMYFFIYC